MLPVVKYRRDLHRIPEEEDRLPKTCGYVLAVLERLNCRVITPTPSGVCAWFDAGKQETMAFRADMDALPVEEQTGSPFTSEHPGFMHACGHDGHTAMLLALAEHISTHVEELPRNVLLIFQPAEDRPGGAKAICETGILEKYHVTRIFGMHLWPNLPAGQVFTCPGPMMAQANEVVVTITGKAVHLSRASEGLDALAAGAEYLRRSYRLLSQVPATEPCTLLFGKMHSGTAFNAVSAYTLLHGSLRTYHEEIFHFFRDSLKNIGSVISEETGCKADVQFSDGYPAVLNNEPLYEAVHSVLDPKTFQHLDTPVLASEDFSFYQKEVPGLYFFLGIGNTPELHAQDFDFDDEHILPLGLDFWKKLLLLP